MEKWRPPPASDPQSAAEQLHFRGKMVRLLSVLFPSAGLLTLPCLINSLLVEGTSFVKRALVAEICGAANYYICSDENTCCPDGFICQGLGCVKGPDNSSNDPTTIVITVTVTASPRKKVLGTSAIAGIAVGGVIILLAAGVIIFFCLRKRKIGKEVLKAYEDPSRNMYDQVVVEGKRVSVVPVGTTQQRRQTQTNPSEAQELANMEIAAVGVKPEEQYSQQAQQYQTYQQQPQQQTYYNQNQEQIQQFTELGPGQAYTPQPQAPAVYVPSPIPLALRVGSPVNPIRADSMGLIPVAADTTDGGQQQPHQFNPAASTIQYHSITLPPPHHQNTESIPQFTSSPTSHSVSPPPQTPTPELQSAVYYQPTPSLPLRETNPLQTPEKYQSPQIYQTPEAAYQQYQQDDIPPPKNNYSQYQQYPELIPSSVSPVQQQNQYTTQGHNNNNNNNNSNWGHE